jgi:fumarylacetoacetase
VNQTHDPALESWVESANAPGADFPIQNLPLGVFRRRGADEVPRGGIAIGDMILDLAACDEAGVFSGRAEVAAAVASGPTLNALMALGRETSAALREQASAVLARGDEAAPRDRALRGRLLVPMAEAELLVPAEVGDYTDFYASVHHATNVGSMFRPDNPLLPNYKWVPIGYHGRASSIVPSGTEVRRPRGQIRGPDDSAPTYTAARNLDYELEVGAFVAVGNEQGSRVGMSEAEDRLFGLCLLNDWSARDVQSWEYQPLGPFLAKNFATTVSPWIVTLEALEPFRAPALARPEGDPEPLPYLDSPANRERGGFALTLEVLLRTERMREAGEAPFRVSVGSFEWMYWTFAQMVTHHASNGCNLRPGDLIGSGTVSGPAEESRGCLLERTWRGQQPLALPNGETRKFLEDGDEVVLRGWCEREGARRIGLGECAGVVVPAS